MRMLGPLSRVCDHKGCTCNEGQHKNRTTQKRMLKRRERQAWKKDVKALV